jgi:hypothetical protein
MPVEQKYTLKAGSTSKLLLFYATDENGDGSTGLRPHLAGAAAAYIREGEPAAKPVPLGAGRLGEWSSGGLAEVDPVLMPGVYQFGAPDEMLAEGSTRVLLQLRFAGARIRPIEVSLVRFDPQDAERMGVWSLANDKRHEFLRRALPRLTEMELELGERAEGELRAKLNTSTGAQDPCATS